MRSDERARLVVGVGLTVATEATRWFTRTRIAVIVAVIVAVAATMTVVLVPTDARDDLNGPPVRLYAPTSPFNRPIPTNPAVDPDSAAQMALMARVGQRGGFVLAIKRYSVPVYLATARTPRRSVPLRARWAPKRLLAGVPIPHNAAPDPARDGQLAIVDPSTRCEYDLWKVRRDGDSWSAGWGNSLRTTGSGIYPHGLSARAAGFALLAGVIFPNELISGRIDHALIFSYPYTSASGFVSPATEFDGRSARPDALPEGVRLQLDPAFDVSSLPPYEQTIARTLQRYGMYLADTGATNISLYAVNPQSYVGNPYGVNVPDTTYVSLAGIPLTRFRVLAHGPVIPATHDRLVASGCGSFR